MSPRTRISFWFAMVIAVAAEAQVAAQCSTQWLPTQGVPGTDGPIRATTTWDPDGTGPLQPVVVVGGAFQFAGSVFAPNIATYDPASGVYSALGTGMNNYVNALATLPNGDLVAGGYFNVAGGVSASGIARWDGTSWSAMGSGMTVGGYVRALTTLPNGDVVAGGWFQSAGGVSASCIARWNGASWSALGSGTNGDVFALTALANGDLVAGGSFTLAGGVSASRIARWNGTNWSALGPGISGSPTSFPPAMVLALVELPNGNLVAGGYFTSAGFGGAAYVARWDGTSWWGLGWGTPSTLTVISALAVLPNGDLMVGGSFTSAGVVSAASIARWNGTSWSALGSGTNGSVNAMETLTNGDILVGGGFTTAGGVVCANAARLTTTCPAAATSFGAGCTGSAGPNVLTATSLPWTGSTFRAVATGMPTISLALSVIGFSTVAMPLPAILPQGVAGCTLWASPDLLVPYVPSAGSVTTQIAIPNTVVLAGQILHQQVVPIELDAAGNIVSLTSTNALTLTIGAF